jgi:C4-type Zn-finger protein
MSDDEGYQTSEGSVDPEGLEEALAMLRDVNIDNFQEKVEGGVEVTARVDDYFEQANLKGETSLDLVQCPKCDEQCYVASCRVAHSLFPSLDLYSTTCPDCSFKRIQALSGLDRNSVLVTPLRVTFKVNSLADLGMDILKSRTASLEIPEVGLELTEGTLGNVYSTVGGLIQLAINDMSGSGATVVGEEGLMGGFLQSLRDLLVVKEPFTVIVEDVLGYAWLGCGENAEGVEVLPFEDRGGIPADNLPADYADSEEYLADRCAELGIRAAPASYDGMGRGAFAVKPFKAGDLVGNMFGVYSREFLVSGRLVDCENLKFRFRTNVYLDGAPMCPVTFINDPSFGAPKQDGVTANCLLSCNERTPPNEEGYHCVYALKDIDASPEHPVELWMEYRATAWSEEQTAVHNAVITRLAGETEVTPVPS